MTPEQKQLRIEQIQSGDQEWRKTAYELGDVLAGHESDVDFLLSLVKEQETDPRPYGNQHYPYCVRHAGDKYDAALACTCYDYPFVAATRMRSACVEKVRALRDEWNTEAQDPRADLKNLIGVRARAKVDAANEAITELESLSIIEQEHK